MEWKTWTTKRMNWMEYLVWSMLTFWANPLVIWIVFSLSHSIGPWQSMIEANRQGSFQGVTPYPYLIVMNLVVGFIIFLMLALPKFAYMKAVRPSTTVQAFLFADIWSQLPYMLIGSFTALAGGFAIVAGSYGPDIGEAFAMLMVSVAGPFLVVLSFLLFLGASYEWGPRTRTEQP